MHAQKEMSHDSAGKGYSYIPPPLPVAKRIAPPSNDSSFVFQVIHVLQQLIGSEASFLYPFRNHQVPSLSKLCREVRLKEGLKFVQQGESANFIAIIILGRMRVDRVGLSTLEFSCGDSIGELGLLQSGHTRKEYRLDGQGRWEQDRSPSSVWNETATAMENCILATIPHGDLREFAVNEGIASVLHRHLGELALTRAMHQVHLTRDDYQRQLMERSLEQQARLLKREEQLKYENNQIASPLQRSTASGKVSSPRNATAASVSSKNHAKPPELSSGMVVTGEEDLLSLYNAENGSISDWCIGDGKCIPDTSPQNRVDESITLLCDPCRFQSTKLVEVRNSKNY